MAYCHLPTETGWNTMEPREGNVWTSLNMAPSQRITRESPMNLVKHMKRSPLQKEQRFKRAAWHNKYMWIWSGNSSKKNKTVYVIPQIIRCLSTSESLAKAQDKHKQTGLRFSYLWLESVWQRRRPPYLVCQSGGQTSFDSGSTGRQPVSESCWTKSDGACWRSPDIPHLCLCTTGEVTGGNKNQCRSICTQLWTQPTESVWI